MRIRTIKPEFWESESLGRVSRDARLLFVALFNCCDDSGRARASSRLLASRLFPYDQDAVGLIPSWLNELSREGCIRMYMVDGSHYLDIPNWLKHQKIDHASQSKLPTFAESSRVLSEASRNVAGELELELELELEGNGKGTLLLHPADASGGGSTKTKEEKKLDPVESEFMEEWDSIRKSISTPTRHNRKLAMKAWVRRRKEMSREVILWWWFKNIVTGAKNQDSIPAFDVEKQWGCYDDIIEKYEHKDTYAANRGHDAGSEKAQARLKEIEELSRQRAEREAAARAQEAPPSAAVQIPDFNNLFKP